jgi:hypothetical protein
LRLGRWRDVNSHLAGESAKGMVGGLPLVHARSRGGFLESCASIGG